MQKFEDTLKYADVTLWLQLQHQEIRPQYYAFRWLTLLLSQEFELPGWSFLLKSHVTHAHTTQLHKYCSGSPTPLTSFRQTVLINWS